MSEPELKLANQLIEQLAAKRFNPDEYVDEHRARVQAAIQRKVEGKEVSIAEAPSFRGDSNVVDLMDALKASLRGSRSAPVKRKAPRRAPATGGAGSSSRKSSRR